MGTSKQPIPPKQSVLRRWAMGQLSAALPGLVMVALPLKTEVALE